MKSSIIPVFIPHLGCPHKCVFCNQRRIASDSIPTAEDVKNTVNEALKYARKPQICFYGGSFTAVPGAMQEEYLSAVMPFVDRGLCDSIRLSTRPDAIDEEVCERLLRFGVRTVELGVQSMDDGVLQSSGRGHTAQDTVNAVSMLKRYGFEIILQIMPGLPGADREKDLETARRCVALAPNGVRVYPVCVIRDTELCDMFERGEYEPLTVERAAELCAEIWERFEAAGIPVVRCGLNPTDELSGGSVVGGAYHPAMGQLARSKMLLRRVLRRIGEAENPAGARITVPKDRLSDMRGQKNANVAAIRERYPGLDFVIAEDADQKESVKIVFF